MLHSIWKNRKRIFCLSVFAGIYTSAVAVAFIFHTYQKRINTCILFSVGSELKISVTDFKWDTSQKHSITAPAVLVVNIPKIKHFPKISAVAKVIHKESIVIKKSFTERKVLNVLRENLEQEQTQNQNIEMTKEPQTEEFDLDRFDLSRVIAGTWVPVQKIKLKVVAQVKIRKIYIALYQKKLAIVAHVKVRQTHLAQKLARVSYVKVKQIHLPRKMDAIAGLLSPKRNVASKQKYASNIKHLATHKHSFKHVMTNSQPAMITNGLELLAKSKDKSLLAYSDVASTIETPLNIQTKVMMDIQPMPVLPIKSIYKDEIQQKNLNTQNEYHQNEYSRLTITNGLAQLAMNNQNNDYSSKPVQTAQPTQIAQSAQPVESERSTQSVQLDSQISNTISQDKHQKIIVGAVQESVPQPQPVQVAQPVQINVSRPAQDSAQPVQITIQKSAPTISPTLPTVSLAAATTTQQQQVVVTKPMPSLSELQKQFSQMHQQREEVTQQQPQPTVGVPQSFNGQITEAFTGGTQFVADATLQILGTPWTVKTDSNGQFTFPELAVSGVLPLVVTKEGYLSRRIELHPGHEPPVIELISENSAALSAMAAHEKRTSGSSLIFGELSSPTGESTQAMKIEMHGPLEINADNILHPVYLDEAGIPQAELEMTSTRGQFLFLNIQAGTYSILITDTFGQERAPHLVYIGESEGLIRKFSMGEQKIIMGQLQNAASLGAVVDQAQVQLLGSTKLIQTDTKGHFTLGPLYVDCADLNYLQVDKTGFYRNRIDYQCDTQNQEHPVYVFQGSYVESVALDAHVRLQGSNGVVLGHVSFNQSVKMQLWGPEELNPGDSMRGKDFYFDQDGVLNVRRNLTSENGNFAILEAPAGFSYVQAFNQDNRTLSYWPIFTSASTVNIYIQ